MLPSKTTQMQADTSIMQRYTTETLCSNKNHNSPKTYTYGEAFRLVAYLEVQIQPVCGGKSAVRGPARWGCRCDRTTLEINQLTKRRHASPHSRRSSTTGRHHGLSRQLRARVSARGLESGVGGRPESKPESESESESRDAAAAAAARATLAPIGPALTAGGGGGGGGGGCARSIHGRRLTVQSKRPICWIGPAPADQRPPRLIRDHRD